MKTRVFAILAAAACTLGAPPALARNFHVAGGIQYVVQGQKEKAKGNDVDARRIYGKAVAQLNEGLGEDPGDLEAWDYLGIAYAELDSAERAGWAFSQGIKSSCTDEKWKKLCQRLKENREHYWVLYFNNAIRVYQNAVDAAGENSPPDSGRAMAAVIAMRRALAMNPENAKTYCNLAAFLANARHGGEAMETVEAGLKVAPADSCLLQRKAQLANVEVEKAASSGDLDTAIPGLERMLASNPNDAATALRLGELYFQQGTKLTEQARKADGAARKDLEEKARSSYQRSAQNFGKYVELKPDDRDGRYNHALALLQADDYAGAARAAHAGMLADPTSPDFHSVLGNAYRGLKLEEPANGHQLVSRALREGTKEADPAAFAQAAATRWGATSFAAKKLKELGAPEEVRTQTMGDYPVETWLWWGKKRAAVLSKGQKVVDLDYATLATASAPKPSTAPKTSPASKSSGSGKGSSASGNSR